MIVTTTMVREIRRRRAAAEPLASIAADIGLHYNTVWKYASDSNLETALRRERRYLASIKADPVKMKRRRETTLAFHERRKNQT